MKSPSNSRRFGIALYLAVAFTFAGQAAYSADGTWVMNPADNNWNNPANWSSGTVPGHFDTASFGSSNITNINITQGTSLKYISFNEDTDAFTFTALPGGRTQPRSGDLESLRAGTELCGSD